MKFETYLLPEFWAPALINADFSGMEDSDISELAQWLADVKPGTCVQCDDSREFSKWHDAIGYVLACDCINFTFQVAE